MSSRIRFFAKQAHPFNNLGLAQPNITFLIGRGGWFGACGSGDKLIRKSASIDHANLTILGSAGHNPIGGDNRPIARAGEGFHPANQLGIGILWRKGKMANDPIAIQALRVPIDSMIKHNDHLTSTFPNSITAQQLYQLRFIIRVRKADPRKLAD